MEPKRSEPIMDFVALKEFAEGKTESEHLAAIGAVAAKWSLLEAIIDTASIGLASIAPEIGVCFTAQIGGSARKLDAYIALARFRHISDKEIDKLIAFAQKTNNLSVTRNRIVHDVWIWSDSMTPHRLEVTAKQVSKIEAVPMSTNEVLSFSDRIDRHIERFKEYSSRIAGNAK